MNTPTVSTEEIKKTIRQFVGSKRQAQIKKKNAEMVICYVRGFADEKHNIILISEESDSLSMNIMEIKNINEMQFIHVN